MLLLHKYPDLGLALASVGLGLIIGLDLDVGLSLNFGLIIGLCLGLWFGLGLCLGVGLEVVDESNTKKNRYANVYVLV